VRRGGKEGGRGRGRRQKEGGRRTSTFSVPAVRGEGLLGFQSVGHTDFIIFRPATWRQVNNSGRKRLSGTPNLLRRRSFLLFSFGGLFVSLDLPQLRVFLSEVHHVVQQDRDYNFFQEGVVGGKPGKGLRGKRGHGLI
jgi:hypothetical protein